MVNRICRNNNSTFTQIQNVNVVMIGIFYVLCFMYLVTEGMINVNVDK